MANYRDLIVWQKSMLLVEEIYRLIRLLPREEAFVLTDQIRRSVISIPSNIAEGHGRGSDKDFVRFLNIANGSLCELETQLELCVRLNYITADRCASARELCAEVGRMLYALIRSRSEV